jgi:molybdenum cofactor biosynthesis enzyme MoaA
MIDMKKIELQNNHKRVLAGTFKTIEEELLELESVLSKKNNSGQLKKIVATYSDSERKYLLEKIEKLKNENQKIFNELDLTTSEVLESQIVKSRITFLWTVLHDSKSKSLRKYGDLSKESSIYIDKLIDGLIQILDEIN